MTQDTALMIMKTGANVFVTGEPGAGKTFLVNKYISFLKESGVEPSITASTGIAATHIGGMTIHSWSGIGVRKNIGGADIDELMQKEKLVKRLNNAKVLIIDEISMLNSEVLDSVEFVCKKLRMRDEPFGGLQVIFVGDFFQLPPVKSFDYQPKFAFESSTWQKVNPIICYIEEQHRQGDGELSRLLSNIRSGGVTTSAINFLESRKIEVDIDSQVTKLFTHNVNVDQINEQNLKKLSEREFVFEMTSHGNKGYIESLKKNCLSPERLCLKVGAKVMFTKNKPESDFVNGTLGEVIGFENNGLYPIVLTKQGERITVTYEDWAIEEDGKILAKITQLPLRLAWAITVHKSQGMTLDEAIVDLSLAFEFGQGYVALSRVRSEKGLYLIGYNKTSLLIHPKVSEFDKYLRELSREANDAFLTMKVGEISKLQDNFFSFIGAVLDSVKVEKNVSNKDSKATGKLAKIREEHSNAFKRWTPKEELLMVEMFNSGNDIKFISKKLGRKEGGIKARLIKLGLIEDDYVKTQGEALSGE